MSEKWLQHLEYINSDLPIMSSHTFYSPALSENSIVYDFGGSTAAFSRAMEHFYQCSCFVAEATSHNFNRIEETDRVKKFHCAICGVDGPIKIWLAADEFHWGSLTKPGDFQYNNHETVPGKTFQTFMEEISSSPPDLVKVDIEGAEFDMFESTPDAVLREVGQFTVEFHDFMKPDWTPYVHRTIDRLSDLNFNVFSYSRKFHGDVLFLNRDVKDLSNLKRFYFGTLLKYQRGIRRMTKRYI